MHTCVKCVQLFDTTNQQACMQAKLENAKETVSWLASQLARFRFKSLPSERLTAWCLLELGNFLPLMMRLNRMGNMRNCKQVFFDKMKETMSPTSIGDYNSRKHFTDKLFMFIHCYSGKHPCKAVDTISAAGKTFGPIKIYKSHKKWFRHIAKNFQKYFPLSNAQKKVPDPHLISLNQSKPTSSSTPVFALFTQWETINS